MGDVRPRPSATVAHRIVGGQAAIVDPADSSVYWLNEVATRVWQLADGSRTGGDIAGLLCEEFEVDRATAESDVDRMVADLTAKGLLEPESP